MQQIRTILANLAGQVQSQTKEWVYGDVPLMEAVRHFRERGLAREVRDEVRFLVNRRKTVQKIADVGLIAGEMLADGVGVNGKAHYQIPV
jgi:hypothetical protein